MLRRADWFHFPDGRTADPARLGANPSRGPDSAFDQGSPGERSIIQSGVG